MIDPTKLPQGADASKWQGVLTRDLASTPSLLLGAEPRLYTMRDVDLFRAAKMQFLAIRMSLGVNPDKVGRQNASMLLQEGFSVLGYHFLTAQEPTADQFRVFTKAMDGIPFNIPPAVDLEPNTDRTRPSTEVANNFVARLDKWIPTQPLIAGWKRSIAYTNQVFGDMIMGTKPSAANAALRACYKWVANWNTNGRDPYMPRLWSGMPWLIWQYTVTMDFFPDGRDLDRDCWNVAVHPLPGGATPPPPPPPPPDKLYRISFDSDGDTWMGYLHKEA